MKKFLLIFLLALLPFQMSWAVVAGYCQHEEEGEAAAQHFGHHEHEHKASNDNKHSKNNLGMNDADCGYCHLAGSNFVSKHQSVGIFPIVSTSVEFLLHPYQSYIPDGLTRPVWHLAI